MDLPDPGIELGSPALQVDSLPTELPGNPTEEGKKLYILVILKNNFIYLFLAVLAALLHWLLFICGEQGLLFSSLVVVCGLLIVVASLAVKHRL